MISSVTNNVKPITFKGLQEDLVPTLEAATNEINWPVSNNIPNKYLAATCLTNAAMLEMFQEMNSNITKIMARLNSKC